MNERFFFKKTAGLVDTHGCCRGVPGGGGVPTLTLPSRKGPEKKKNVYPKLKPDNQIFSGGRR